MLKEFLNKDMSILQTRMKEFNEILSKLNEKSSRFKLSNDIAIVANAYDVFELQRKVKNNNFEGKRLEIEDEELARGESSKMEDLNDIYSYQPKSKYISQPQTLKEQQKLTIEENHGEHVFFVQLDSELPMPHFLINISKEKKKIEGIGGIKNAYFGNKIANEDNPDSDRSKQISDIINMSPEVIQKGVDRPFNRNQEEVKQFMNNYNGIQSTKHSRVKNLSYNDRVIDQKPIEPPIAQKIIETEETYFNGDTNSGKEMFWFKWDSFESWKYSFKDDTWSLLEDVKPANKFLYFSSTVHLKNNSG